MSNSSNGVALVAMFLVGLVAGFYGRPLVLDDETTAAKPEAVVVTATPDSNQSDQQAVASDNTGRDDAPQVVEVVVTATPSPTPDYMAELIGAARHFQGDEAAPVTMIEFSDFK